MRADDYARAARNLRSFLEAFDELVGELEPDAGSPLSSFPAWRPKYGHDTRVGVLRAKVAGLTGAAAMAFNTAGAWLDYKPPGTWNRQPVNPAVVWATIFDDEPMLDPPLVTQIGLQALGLLEHMRVEQAERESGFVGAIAWFLTLGPRVRQAAGLPPRSAPGVVVTSVVVLIQGVLIAALGGALVYPLADWLGWLP